MRKNFLIFISVLFTVIVGISFLSKDNDLKLEEINVDIPVKTIQDAKIVGWTAYWEEDTTIRVLRDVVVQLNAFSPILYRINSAGSLESIPVRHRKEFLELARAQELPITPVIGDDFDFERVQLLLYDEKVQQRFREQLIDEALKEGFGGWDIDIESLKSSDRQAFTRFVANIASDLHKNDLRLNIILFAKDQDEMLDEALAQDYRELGSLVDQVRLMVYGFHNDSTPPGGQAPLAWLRRVLNYATKMIPSEKIVLGLSTHGYDWSKEGSEALTYPEVSELLSFIGAQPIHDRQEASKFLTYELGGEQHSLWFEDVETIRQKMLIAINEFGIDQFALWRIGAEDPEIWKVLKAPKQ